MSGAMGNTTSNIANDDDLKREKYNEKQRDAYKKLSSGKKQSIQRVRAQKSRLWRDDQKKKKESMETEIERINTEHFGEMETMKRKVAFEKNRMVLYALPGLGAHRIGCPLRFEHNQNVKQLPSRHRPTGQSVSVIIPLHSKCTMDVVVASHLLCPSRSGAIHCHHGSVMSLEVHFGEGLIFFDNLIHRGGKSSTPDVRCFGSVGTDSRSLTLENKNYSRHIEFCRDDGCYNCESLTRVKERCNGELMNVVREKNVSNGLIIDQSMSLVEHGFVIIKLGNETKTINEELALASPIQMFTDNHNGSVGTMIFKSMTQEMDNLERFNMKRMILVIPGEQKASDYIRMMQPLIHSYLDESFLTIGSYLHSELGLSYNLNDFTLLRNGDAGTGLQTMHTDKKSICNCRHK